MLVLLSVAAVAGAQSVIFPQEKQAGVAVAEVAADGESYVLRNDLFAASFILKGGALYFGGCEEQGLLSGTELFSVRLASVEVVQAPACGLTT